MFRCPECNTLVEAGAIFCDNCGLRLQSPGAEQSHSPGEFAPVDKSGARKQDAEAASPDVPFGTCSACGYVNIPGEMFCQNCGVQLAPVVSAPPPPPRPVSTPGAGESGAQYRSPLPGVCPQCGFINNADDVFCQSCGLQVATPISSSVAPPPMAPPPMAPPLRPSSDTPAAHQAITAPSSRPKPAEVRPLPFKLILQATGAEVAIPPGKDELLVGRSDVARGNYPDLDLTPFGGESGGVSRVHARLVIQGSQVFIEDLNSTNFTFVNKHRLPPGERHLLQHGDEVRLGLLALTFLLR